MRRLLFIVLFLSLMLEPAAAARVRLLVMDGVHLEHLVDEDLPHFQHLLDQGSLALVNTNTGGGRNSEHAAVTLGAGSRALGPGAAFAYREDELVEGSLARQVLARRTGILPEPGNLVLVEMAAIHAANEDLPYVVRPGYLATRLREAGFSVAVLANSDGEELFRPSAAIAADENGIIQAGLCGSELLTRDPDFPFGLRADLDAFTQGLEQWLEADLLVIDTGDTSRVQQYAGHLSSEQKDALRHQALRQLDQVLGEILADFQPGDLLLITSLQADRELGAEEGRWLTPLVAYGGAFSPGLLGSATTRRPGVVANLDITAAILNHFGLWEPGEIYGQPPAVYGNQGVDHLLRREWEMGRVYRLRTPVIQGFIAAVIILVALALAALFWRWRRLGWLRFAMLMVLSTPLLFLALGAVPGHPLTVIFWLAGALAIAGALWRLPPRQAMTILATVTALAVATDALVGAPLQQRSILGYDAISGARYYGIGNEYMGVLVGSVLLAASGLRRRWRIPVYGVVVAVLMLPGVGANFGGTLASVIGFSFALVESRDLHNKKHRRWAVLALIGFGLGFIILNLVGERSHVGRFLATLASDPGELLPTIERKLSMAWRLVRWSLWSRAFGALLLAAIGILVAGRRFWARQLGAHWPLVRGAIAAAAAALLLNDSGIVAAATTLLFLSFPLFYYQFSESSSLT
ncbi:MAG: hypothetical protein FH749_01375 [Firmicutes bacterium]|nr:hypothetical protein [Bacillota bacterium]